MSHPPEMIIGEQPEKEGNVRLRCVWRGDDGRDQLQS